ncbi:hypothetical protein N692_02910 [Lactiplantibacillus plantarum EGD-AQ4]|nr:hypothetical protein N692_02910 [Lactiplantibacillus plantarum EGD-AQ4]
MTDERPPNLAQLTPEYLLTSSSSNGLIGINAELWYLITEKIT